MSNQCLLTPNFKEMFWKEKLYLELRKTDFVKIFPKSSQSVKHTMEAVEKNIRS